MILYKHCIYVYDSSSTLFYTAAWAHVSGYQIPMALYSLLVIGHLVVRAANYMYYKFLE